MAGSWGVNAVLAGAYCFAALVASVCTGQVTTADFGPGTFESLEVVHYRVVVDHGPSLQPVTVSVNVATPSLGGLIMSVVDVDEWVGYGTSSTVSTETSSPGSVTLDYTSPARAGVHSIVVVLRGYLFGFVTPYAGSVTISAGNIVYTTSTVVEDGYYWSSYYVAGYLLYRPVRQWSAKWGPVVYCAEFGSIEHPSSFRVVFEAPHGIGEVRLVDVTGQAPVVLARFPGDATGAMSVDAPVSIPAHSGVAFIQIEVDAYGAAEFGWEIYLPSDVYADSSFRRERPRRLHREVEPYGIGCAAAASPPGPAALVAFTLLLLPLLRNRHKRRT